MNADQAFLSKLASIISDSEISLLANEGGFQAPNCFNIERIRSPLRTQQFPEDNDFEYLWAIHECGLGALEKYSKELRLYLSSLYIYCNKRKVWAITAQGDYYYLFVEASLTREELRPIAIDFLGWLSTRVAADEGFDDGFALFSELLLLVAQDVAALREEMAQKLLKRNSRQFRDELYVCEIGPPEWQSLFDRACALGQWSAVGFQDLFYGEGSRVE